MFLGGFTGEKIRKDLSVKENIELLDVKINGDSRINVKITNDKETAINASGPVATEENIRDFLKKLDGVSEGDYVAISGSFCKGVDKSIVSEIAGIVEKHKAKLVLDLSNLKFEDYRDVKPYLIKPNLEELESIFDEKITLDGYEGYVEKLIDAGVENVLLSLGKEGCYFANSEVRLYACGKKTAAVNTVGSGDTMLGYTLAVLSTGGTFEEAVKYGEAAGRAKAAMYGLPTLEDVRKAYQQVRLERK